MLDAVKRFQPDWQHYRVIHSKYPPENLFDQDDAINLLLGELESLTSDRLHNWAYYVRQEDYRHGPGWGAVMASFCYPRAGRFSTDDSGAYYCASSSIAALKEWAHHVQTFWHQDMGFTDDASATVRCYTGQFEKPLLDVRGQQAFHTPDSYTESQALATWANKNKEYGILYHSVRRPGEQCAALLRPPATCAVTLAGHYTLIFDGKRFTDFARVGKFKRL